MALRVLQQFKTALSHLNSDEVRQDSERAISIGLQAADDASYDRLERLFAPAPGAKSRVERIREGVVTAKYDIHVVQQGLPVPGGALTFDPASPQKVITDVLDQHQELMLALARQFPTFRVAATTRIIRDVAKENALFSLATAVPGIVPLISLPLTIGEFASDTAFLTMNQTRMAFLLAAAHGCEVGFRRQKAEVGSVIASAFGWRAIARELVGKIPLGGGLIPKAAIAYAGTYVVGLSLERLYRQAAPYSVQEQEKAYKAALEQGKEIAGDLLQEVKKK